MTVDVADNMTPETGGEPGNTTGDPNSQGSTDQTEFGSGEIAFDNLIPGSSTALPQLKVVNLTPYVIQTAFNTIDMHVGEEIAAESNSDLLPVPIGTNAIWFSVPDLNTTDPAVIAQRLQPFNAAEFTVTTVILRANGSNAILATPLTTQTRSSSSTTALARVIQIHPLGDTVQDANLSLLAGGAQNSGTDVNFDGVSFSVATEYSDVLPGTYTLTDSASRFPQQNITIEAGTVYTLIINSDTAPATTVLIDSN